MFSFRYDDVYAIITPIGYDVYVNGQKYFTLEQLPPYERFPVTVYNSISEVPK